MLVTIITEHKGHEWQAGRLRSLACAPLWFVYIMTAAMRVDRELVSHVARLARIELTEPEIELFTTHLASILKYMEKLNEVQEETEPFVFGDFLTHSLREDAVTPSLPVDQVMKAAPSQKRNLFRVPRIIP